MQELATTIAKELEQRKHCAVYHLELNRVWPTNGGEREKAVAAFAQQHGWLLRHYKDGFVAIFIKELPAKRN